MNPSQARRTSGKEYGGRSLANANCNTLAVATFVAKDMSVASIIAGSDAVIKTAMIFVYEQMWVQIQGGKEDYGVSTSSTEQQWHSKQVVVVSSTLEKNCGC